MGSQRVTPVLFMEEFGPSSYRPERDGRSRSPPLGLARYVVRASQRISAAE